MAASNKKGKGKDPAGSQPLPKYKGKKGANEGRRGRRATSARSIAMESMRSRVRAGGSPSSEDSNPSGRRIHPPMGLLKQSVKAYRERLRGRGIRTSVTGQYKQFPSRNPTSGTKHNSGLSKKHTKNPKG